MDNIKRKDSNMAYITDDKILAIQAKCRKILQKLNFMDRSDFAKISEVVYELIGSKDAFINPPFYCDYGSNIKVGKNFFANYNCTIIDVSKVTIGDNCFLGPSVSIYTAGHPIHPLTRNSLYEYGKPISIGNNCWIGGGSIILPGVKIGNNVVIGAGSVVTKDIPDWCVAAGNPCKVIRKITDDDKKKLFKDDLIDEKAWEEITNKYPELK